MFNENVTKYSSVAQAEEGEHNGSYDGHLRRSSSARFFTWKAIGLISLITNGFLFGFILASFRSQAETNQTSTALDSTDAPLSYTGVHTTSKTIQNQWYTKFSAANDEQYPIADAAWDNVHADHGIIAVPLEWANKHSLPTSFIFPPDRSKRVFVLEAYHLLHCVQLSRKTMRQLQTGEPLTYHFDHVEHCFDSLRQHIMCHADDTPLYVPGNGTAGYHQPKQCKDWSHLRNWATENSACFKDVTPTAGVFGKCGDGQDGLEELREL